MLTDGMEQARRGDVEAVLRRVLPEDILSPWRPKGKCEWTPWALCVTALAWALAEEGTLGDRFTAGRNFAASWLGRHLPTSIQGFQKALLRGQDVLLTLVREHIQHGIVDLSGRTFRTAGLVPLVVDGTRIDTPRSPGNEARFRRECKPRKRRTAKQAAHADIRPQIWLTLVWHATMRLPWSWRLGPFGSSERAHLLDMLEELPLRSLVIGDAGFTGYDFWQAVLAAEQQLLVRVGNNVRLLSQLAFVRTRGDLVFLWPERAQRRSQPPIVLRQVRLTRKGRPIMLVTSLLDPERLDDVQLSTLYRQRWGIEVFYRSFKQTFGRGKLRSTSPDHAVSELQWSLIALTGVQLVGVEALRKARYYRQQLSTAQALKILRRTLWPDRVSAREAVASLSKRLAAAGHDGYRRHCKTRRPYPQKKRTKPTGIAILTRATYEQQLAATPYLASLPL